MCIYIYIYSGCFELETQTEKLQYEAEFPELSLILVLAGGGLMKLHDGRMLTHLALPGISRQVVPGASDSKCIASPPVLLQGFDVHLCLV